MNGRSQDAAKISRLVVDHCINAKLRIVVIGYRCSAARSGCRVYAKSFTSAARLKAAMTRVGDGISVPPAMRSGARMVART